MIPLDNRSVAIVLVNWNGADDTIACIKSINALNPVKANLLIIVDNASSDYSIKKITSSLTEAGYTEKQLSNFSSLSKEISTITAFSETLEENNQIFLVSNKSNLGFAAANNIGYKVAKFIEEIDYLWFLNNDTEVEPNCLSKLLNRMNQDSTIGICGATLLHDKVNKIVQAYGGVKYSLITGRGKHIGAGDVFSEPKDNALIEKDISYISGASMFVSVKFIDSIGLMCEKYFLYNEEVDWAWRAKKQFKLGVETSAVVYHKEGASIGTESRERPASVLSDFYQTRNKLLFAKEYTPWFLPTIWIFLMIRAVKRWHSGHKANAMIMFKVLFGKRKADPIWFLKRQ
ncbi:glycosyltransferase family 2 protein [Ampullimonas aquatilis]|uniref:glycosyltransferase family 2 protein n=1 Tax=Ampullimonas aquatilis TaxID=1341549 RepID=UPI003C70660F